MAELGEVPFRRYYGSIDSTPLFVMLAGAYLDRTGDKDALRQLWPSIEAALGWIDAHGDRDGDGFVEYGRRTAEGLANQGWEGSPDRKSVVSGKGVSVRVDLGGRRNNKKKKKKQNKNKKKKKEKNNTQKKTQKSNIIKIQKLVSKNKM